MQRIFRAARRGSSTAGRRRASGSGGSPRTNGPGTCAGSSRFPATSSGRWRCATTATSSGCTTPTSATAAASCSPSCATTQGRLLDLGTKGSGQTPWSRGADGRLTLKGGVREVLATEMLEALGVNTSKSFALFETGEELVRGDEPSPTRSAVLTRLSHGHIRIGSFQRQAFNRDTDEINALVGYSLEHLYGEAPADDSAENALRLFALASEATAGLAASYMAAGFVHGVLNSDNINITGESFDYGPWRFTPHWDGDFTAAYFDHYGLYAFGRQPEAIHWDLAQLAGCLTLVADVEELTERISGWGGQFDKALIARLAEAAGGREPERRSGPRSRGGAGRGAGDSRGDYRPAVLRLARRPRPGTETYAAEPFRALAAQLAGREREPSHEYWRGPEPCSMHIDEVEAIWDAIAEQATTGRRSTPRSPPSALWARQCRTRLDRAAGPWWSAGNAEDADVLRARDRRRAVVGNARRRCTPRSPPRAKPCPNGRIIRSPTGPKRCAASPTSSARARRNSRP